MIFNFITIFLSPYRTCIGIKCIDGVVLAHEKLVDSKLLVPGGNNRIQTIDMHIGFVSSRERIMITTCANSYLIYLGELMGVVPCDF